MISFNIRSVHFNNTFNDSFVVSPDLSKHIVDKYKTFENVCNYIKSLGYNKATFYVRKDENRYYSEIQEFNL